MCTYSNEQQQVIFDDSFVPFLEMIRTHSISRKEFTDLIPKNDYPDHDNSEYEGRCIHFCEYDIQNSTVFDSEVKYMGKLKKKKKSKVTKKTNFHGVLLRTNYRLSPAHYKGLFLKS